VNGETSDRGVAHKSRIATGRESWTCWEGGKGYWGDAGKRFSEKKGYSQTSRAFVDHFPLPAGRNRKVIKWEGGVGKLGKDGGGMHGTRSFRLGWILRGICGAGGGRGGSGG